MWQGRNLYKLYKMLFTAVMKNLVAGVTQDLLIFVLKLCHFLFICCSHESSQTRGLYVKNCPFLGLTAEGCSFLMTLLELLGIKE